MSPSYKVIQILVREILKVINTQYPEHLKKEMIEHLWKQRLTSEIDLWLEHYVDDPDYETEETDVGSDDVESEDEISEK